MGSEETAWEGLGWVVGGSRAQNCGGRSLKLKSKAILHFKKKLPAFTGGGGSGGQEPSGWMKSALQSGW